MIADGKRSDEVKKWHYVDLKSEPTDDEFNGPTKILFRLFRGITLNHHGDFYC